MTLQPPPQKKKERKKGKILLCHQRPKHITHISFQHHDMHMHREKLLGRAMPVEMYCSHHIPGHWKAASPRKRKRFIRVHEVNMFQQLMVLKLKATKEGKVVSSQFPPVSTTLGQTVEKLLSAAHAKMSDSLVGSLVVKGTVFGTILVKDYLGTTLGKVYWVTHQPYLFTKSLPQFHCFTGLVHVFPSSNFRSGTGHSRRERGGGGGFRSGRPCRH